MKYKLILKCEHEPKYRLTCSCLKTGDYLLELCEICYKIENKNFVIKEETIQ